MESVSKHPIAIVGLGCVLPDAPDVETFWRNLESGKDSIREVPVTRWDPSRYYAPAKAADMTYTKIGAFVEDDAFNGIEYRMPPNMVAQVDNAQRWALAATRQALKDAGYLTGIKGDEGKPFDRDRCAVILGNAMGGETNKLATKRAFWPEARAAIEADEDFQALPGDQRTAILQRTEERYKSDTLPVTEDTMPGHLSNVFAGRIANVFDLAGKNFTTDAACASSLAALDAAMATLRHGESDMVIWGGADRSMDITPYIQFSAIGALSPDGSRPFDKDANGFVMGEGCAMFILKRLEDAERDGDKIYAVVRGVGASSDGKGKGITAPNPKGQVKAVRRAYKDAEMDPFTVGYLEAHGTSTPVGDPVELTSVIEAFRDLSDAKVPTGAIKVGSVKSNIGHLKAAAGAAGMLKAVLALHKGKIPPSINVKTLNPRIEWDTSPFAVATQGQDWPRPEGHPRRAAVSSFGFGGTNFHVVLEEHIPGALRLQPTGQAMSRSAGQAPPTSSDPATMTLDIPAFQAYMQQTGAALEAQSLVLDADRLPDSIAAMATSNYAETGEGPRIRDLYYDLTKAGVRSNRRVGLAPADPSEIPKKLELAQKAATNPSVAKLAFQQGVFINQSKPQGKVAFLFPGQGTQYVNMGRDLARKYAVVKHTFAEADEVLFDELDGVKLTDILWPTPDTPENRAASEEKLKLTEFTQPAVLAMDVAILRLLKLWGIKPDVVAGHSLGEYGALVAAGVMSFADALHAVAARGREMAHVEVPDLGKMASVPADWETVQAAIEGVDGYVICANKNCPSQTVIAGSSHGVDAAVAKLTEQGLQCIMLPVSAAFHSDIVAPASKPLRHVLGRLAVHPPKVQCISNVGAKPYPDDPEAIRDNLATQVASPVEWIGIIERMVADGVTTFIEVGPKKALTGFCMDILKDQIGTPGGPVAICANHPKKGEIQHINELFAFLGAWGFQPALPDLTDGAMYTAAFRDPTAPFRRASPPAAPPGLDDTLQAIMRRLDALEEPVAATAPMASPTAAPVATTAATTAAPPATATAPATTEPTATVSVRDDRAEAFGFYLGDVTISGISIGLPGVDKPLFAKDNWDRILRGDNLIDTVPEHERTKIADKNIVRLVKGADGNARFEAIDDVAQVIQLAGRRGDFDMAEWGLEGDFAATLDRTFQYAIAAGLEALHDAGIPLQRTYAQTTTGSYLPKEWKLPAPMQNDTGIVFASAFPGYDNLLREVSRFLADKYAGRTLDELQGLYQELLAGVSDAGMKDKLSNWFEDEFERLQDVLPDHGAARYEFNRKFLFNVLSMGHAQLAQFIGAKGPNTQLNAACASTTQAIAVAEDWIRTGRCKRVLVVGADDVTSDAMFEWIGAGFLASGAATTKADVAEAALPFDKRRHGMIVGMGAVGMVIETAPEVEARGMRPIARLLGSAVANSAFHGSRLDVEDIARHMQDLVATAGKRYGIRADTIAANTVFVSHETYTPARGGSASAEIHALRATFGADADQVVIANTKGFTGHPQGAGIEDAIALKMLQRGQVPPIANFKEADPELGDLNLSKGGAYDVRYALRLAAGFGSQIAMTLTELVAREDERFFDEGKYTAWLGQVSGLPGAKTEVTKRTLRIVDQGAPARAEAVAVATEAHREPAPTPPAAPAADAAATTGTPVVDAGSALTKVTQVIAHKTGYPTDMLDPDMDMEADLGIDTVKQAELFGELREMFGVPLNEELQLKDYNTLRKVAEYMAGPGPAEAAVDAPTTAAPAAPPPAVTVEAEAAGAPANGGDADDALEKVTAVIAQKTGYPADMLEPDLDMEADLGIDTVKQAELFGELREMFGVPLNEELQLKDYNTLRKVAQYMAGEGDANASTQVATNQAAAEPGATTAPAPSPPATAATQAPAAPADSSDALAKVTQVIAHKTGYPADMLEPDLDMEADLGIDTVKQAELFGELREMFGVPLNEELQLKDYNTLRKVADYMVLQSTSAAPVTSTPEPTSEPAPGTSEAAGDAVDATTAPIVRRIPCLRPEALPKITNDLPRGPVLVIGDAEADLLDAFKEAGFEPSFNADAPVGLLAIATTAGEVDATVGALFEAAKANPDVGFVCVVTCQDGSHGLESPRDPAMAALAGLGKALKKEFPKATVKVIDLAPDAGLPGPVLDELLQGGPRTEVAYSGTRHVIDVAPEPLADGTPDVAGKTLVVSGGAQGITVELLAALAPQKPNLVLLGRTEMPAEAALWATWDEARWKNEEQAVIERMKAAGDKVTPVAVQKVLSPMKKAAEVSRNLQRLTDLGAEVVYTPADVTDAEAVAAAVAHARKRFGAIHGVIHAAGMEISKDLTSKDRNQFDTVYGIKVNGMKTLADAVADDRLEWLVSFGSIAGRFGNIGQTDYSAANEWLCKATKQLGALWQVPTAFTVAWGPWGEVGMATKGSIMQIMEASGVTPIPTAEGVRQFLAEMATPGIRESVVAGIVGAIDADGQVVDERFDPRSLEFEGLIASHADRFRLLAGIDSVTDEGLVARIEMDQAVDPYAKDHAIDGVPYLPGVFGIEAFAQAASLMADPDHICIGAEDIRFSVPLKQLKDRPAVGRVSVTRSGEGFSCRLTSRMVGPDGKERGEPRTHFEATLQFGPDEGPARTKEVPDCDGSTGKDAIYPPFFHGPSFQVLRAAGPLGDESIGTGHLPYAAAFADGEPRFFTHPLVTEALFQVCGLRTMQEEGKMSLPAGIERLDILSQAPPKGEFRLWARYGGLKDGLRRFDAVAAMPDGRVLVRIVGYQMVETGPVPTPAATPRPSRAEAPKQTRLVDDEPTVAADHAPVPTADVELPEVDGLAFVAVWVDQAEASDAWFTQGELETAADFAAPKRADEWRAGRLAVKALVVGDEIAPTDVTVENDEGGRPHLLVKGRRASATISITHRDGLAIAALGEGDFGIDLETIEPKPDAFIEEAFNADEKPMTDSDAGIACLWAAKEATFKRIGTGLKQALHAWTVTPDGDGGAVCSGPDGSFPVRFFDVDGRVLAVSSQSFGLVVEET